MANISKIRIQNTDYAIKDSRVDNKVDKVSSSTDNAIVRFDGTSGNIQNSGVTINDSNHLTAAKFITSGGTNSQVVLGDGTLDNTFIKSSHLVLDNYIWAENDDITREGFYLSSVHNFLFAANKRFIATHKVYSSSDNSYIKNATINIFDQQGRSDVAGAAQDGSYGVIYVGTKSISEVTTSGSADSMTTYGQGYIILSFYGSHYPPAVSGRIWSGHQNAWVTLTFTRHGYLYIAQVNTSCVFPKAIEITYQGITYESNPPGASVYSLEWYLTHSAIQNFSVVTKYSTAQDLYGNVTAPKFIKRGGTSSQFLKADGSVDSNTYAGAQTSGGAANKAVSIPFGQVDSTSTSTAFTATVDGITELRDGVCVYLKNGVVTSAANCTLNVNGLGDKPMYNTMAATTAISTQWNVNYTMLFIYNSTRVSGGCWDVYYGYYSDANSIGYQLRTHNNKMPVSDTSRYYKIFFTSADNTKLVPASADNTNNTTSARPVNQRPINPFGAIRYNSSNASFAADSIIDPGYMWLQYNIYLGHSFNRTGAALTLTIGKPVFIKCAPQNDGSAIIDANTPYVQDLPTTEDGKIYIFLGVAYSAAQVELQMVHPVYYYKNGSINLWTGTGTQTDVSKSTESNVIDVGGYDLMKINEVKGKSLVMNQIVESFSDNWLANKCTKTLTDGILKIVPSAARCYVYGVNTIQAYSSHKYYCSCHIKANSSITRYIDFSYYAQSFGNISNLEISANWNKIALVNNAAADRSGYACLIFNNCETTDEIYVKNYIVIDLTRMFGAGNEPTTVEEVEAILGNDYYEYNTGEVVGNNVEKLDVYDSNDTKKGSLALNLTELTGKVNGEGTSVTIFPDGLHGVGTVFDSLIVDEDGYARRAVKRMGSRAYTSGDESDTSVITDNTNTFYPLTTPIEYVLDTPVQCVVKVYPNGTVKQVPVMPDSTPMVMDVTYLRDTGGFIGGMMNKLASLEARIAALEGG